MLLLLILQMEKLGPFYQPLLLPILLQVQLVSDFSYVLCMKQVRFFHLGRRCLRPGSTNCPFISYHQPYQGFQLSLNKYCFINKQVRFFHLGRRCLRPGNTNCPFISYHQPYQGFQLSLNKYYFINLYKFSRLPWWLSGKEPTCQCRRRRFHPWVRKIPWRRKWQPTPVFLVRKSHGQRSLVGDSPWGCKGVRHDLVTKQQ